MGNYNRDSNSRDGRRGGYSRSRNSRGRSDRGRADKQMFKAVCSNCGKDCEVPFNPTSDKPVYCSDCFEKMGGRDSRKSFDRTKRSGGRSYSDDKYKAQFESLNKKLDKIIELLQPQKTDDEASLVDLKVEEVETKKSKSKKTTKENPKEETEKTS